MATKAYRFEVRTSENGQGGMFTKTVIAVSMQEAWKEVIKQMSSAGFLNIVTKIEQV
jgi:hypothetical protein